ncbi:uncharacterized protein LOC133679955 [Populus nigra]|uniref:uncharacterized protein LOC133679955 n=1 Tax=Populus nigra TaxID=3691 RepID=UPI002B2778BE|nr:uncharacterized protein LOC133679955 [Populus nigra]
MSFRLSAQFHMPSFSTANRHHKVHNHSIPLSHRMSVFGFWALILLAGTACLSSTYSSSHDLNFPKTEDSITATTSFKEPKEGCYSQRISSEEIQKDNINMEGYSKIDPAPKSTATIVSRPIEHGTPLIPYIPGPTLLDHPKQGRLKSPPSPA